MRYVGVVSVDSDLYYEWILRYVGVVLSVVV